MGKAIAYLILAVVGVLLLRATGLLDGITDRGNLEEREAFWQQTFATEAPAGAKKEAVEAMAARHGVTLECFRTSLRPPVDDCTGDDPGSRGGTSGHPVVLQVNFVFHGDELAERSVSPRVTR